MSSAPRPSATAAESEASTPEASGIKKGYLQPKPIQRPFPAAMNAGGSGRGQHFAAKHCDIVFTVLHSLDMAENRAQVEAYRRLAREEYGRDLRVWSLAYIVQRPTEAQARQFY